MVWTNRTIRTSFRSSRIAAVATVTKTLLNYYLANRQPGETLGYFHRRIGVEAILDQLKHNRETAPLMEKTYDHPNRVRIVKTKTPSVAGG
ncbi:hypothetical protein LCGC14_2300730 [marine sediment metagenome]|uniref:Uncharacterized protein n=1 Tax=marine sediment metagenome TaxID=412755 RepID=A0A0F9FII0_9ZZZZ